jgi:DNA repair exonuclease SbcCD nuclease subunit
MAAFRFIHSADLHLGRRFGTLPEAARGRLIEARHQIISRLADAARDHGARHILVAGDIFDTETPSDPVWRQALSAMGSDPDLQWWLIPGNHDSLAAESLWSRFRDHAPPGVHLINTAQATEIEAGVFLLHAPLPRRHPGRDLTAFMADCITEPGGLRIGLAHGAIRDFSEEGSSAEGIIPPDRAATARLDYLALGDWHGQIRVGDRTWYAGTPERDAFHHAGRGVCLAVTLEAPGAVPTVSPVETGRFVWQDAPLHLLPDQPAGDALLALLPPDPVSRRDHLVRVRVSGRATLAEQAALRAMADRVAPEFCHFVLDDTDLATEFDSADLDEIDRGGALRLAADSLSRDAQDDGQEVLSRRVAAAALNRLYGYLKGDGA